MPPWSVSLDILSLVSPETRGILVEDPAVVYYYRWSSSRGEFVRHTIAGPGEEIGLGRQLTLADLNGDGRVDIVAPGRWGLWVMFNQGAR